MATITAPIWKDTYYTTTADTVNYSIRLDGETIFTGKGVKYPGADDMQLNINKICRNYLECDIATLLTTMPSSNTNLNHPNAQRTFNFYTGSTKVNDYVFYEGENIQGYFVLLYNGKCKLIYWTWLYDKSEMCPLCTLLPE